MRIGGAYSLSGQGEAGICQVKCECVFIVCDKCDGSLWPGANGEAAVLLFEETLGCLSAGFDHQASILIEDTVGSAVLREGVVVAAFDDFEDEGSCESGALLRGGRFVGEGW